MLAPGRDGHRGLRQIGRAHGESARRRSRCAQRLPRASLGHERGHDSETLADRWCEGSYFPSLRSCGVRSERAGLRSSRSALRRGRLDAFRRRPSCARSELRRHLKCQGSGCAAELTRSSRASSSATQDRTAWLRTHPARARGGPHRAGERGRRPPSTRPARSRAAGHRRRHLRGRGERAAASCADSWRRSWPGSKLVTSDAHQGLTDAVETESSGGEAALPLRTSRNLAHPLRQSAENHGGRCRVRTIYDCSPRRRDAGHTRVVERCSSG